MYRKYVGPLVILFYLFLIMISTFYLHSLKLIIYWVGGLIGTICLTLYYFAGSQAKHYKSEWKRAGIEELNREDNVLLNGVIFVEALITYYLLNNVIINPKYTQFIVVTVIMITVVFYILRSYAHIRNNGTFRWYSISAFLLIFSSDLVLIILTYLNYINPKLFEQNDLLFFLLFIVPLFIIPIIMVFLEVHFKKRYSLFQ